MEVKRSVCISLMEDDSLVLDLRDCHNRAEVKNLLDRADRQVRMRLAKGISLSQKESAGKEN